MTPQGRVDMLTYVSVVILLSAVNLIAFPDNCDKIGNVLNCMRSGELDIACDGETKLNGIERLLLGTIRKLHIEDLCMPDLEAISIRETGLSCRDFTVPKNVTIELKDAKCNSDQSTRNPTTQTTRGIFFSSRKPFKVINTIRSTTPWPNVSTTINYPEKMDSSNRENQTKTETLSLTGDFFVSTIVMISMTSFVIACASVFGILRCREYFKFRRERERAIRLKTFSKQECQPSVMQEIEIETLSCNSQTSMELFRLEDSGKLKTS